MAEEAITKDLTAAKVTPNDEPTSKPDKDQELEDASSTAISQGNSLTSTVTAANLQYGLKNYAAAADLYSQATEIQAEQRGEMAPENAELLFLYGRCLYHVAVAKSEVLGGKVAGTGNDEGKKAKGGGQKRKQTTQAAEGVTKNGASAPDTSNEANGMVAEEAAESVEAAEAEIEEKTKESEPYFQLVEQEGSGDEEGAEDDEDGDEDDEDDDDDDFANAYEILDVARVLFTAQLESTDRVNPTATNSGEASEPITSDKGKGKASEDVSIASPSISSSATHIKSRLADTHDLQAEISLENERFADAVTDQRAAVALKTELHPPESSLIAEAHFKLSLALEFASLTEVREAAEQAKAGAGAAIGAAEASSAAGTGSSKDGTSTGLKEGKAEVDEAMREEAAREMEKAIQSCKLRVSKEEHELSSLDAASSTAEPKRKSIKDVKEMIEDMEQRLQDLRLSSSKLAANPLAALSALTGAGPDGSSSAAAGLMGKLLEQTPEQQKESLEEATKTANDLSGLVRRKKAGADAATSTPAVVQGGGSGKGKRKADDENGIGGERGGEGETKRARSEVLEM